MKNCLILMLLMFTGWSYAQSDIASKVYEAIKNSDGMALAQLMQPQVEVSIEDFEGAISRDDARKKLVEFFASHKVATYTPKHSGTSKMGDQYYIGDMKSGTMLYRITVFVKKSNDDGTRVSQLRIEES